MTQFRRAASTDLEGLLPMVRDFHAHEGIALPDEDRRRAVAEALATPDRAAILVAEGALGLQGYGVVAFSVSVEFGGRTAIVDELYVDPHLRGRGIGTGLLEKAQRLAELSGAKALLLEVADVNPEAARLYQARGFSCLLYTSPSPRDRG